MKKTFLFLLFFATLFPGYASADFRIHGLYDLSFIYADQSFSHSDTTDRFIAIDRFRLQLECIHSEDLQGIVLFEIGDIHFGKDATGGALGADRSIVELKNAYVDWTVPNTKLRLRMGIQPISMPGTIQTASQISIPGVLFQSSTILEADMAAISASLPLNETSSLTGFWARAFNDNTENNYNDNTDFFCLINENKFDGHTITPWAMYGLIGQNSLSGKSTTAETVMAEYGLLPNWASLGSFTGSLKGSADMGNAYWGGLAYAGYFDNLGVYFDFTAGHVDLGEFSTANGNLDLKRTGWFAGAMLEYKFDFATPGIVGWYASGDDGDISNGSEMLPYISPWWRGTPYAFGRNHNTYDGRIGYSPAGTWALGIYVKDLPSWGFFEETALRAVYFGGTNSPEMPEAATRYGLPLTPAGLGLRYMTTEDRALELSVENQYHIYDNLLMYSAISYIHMELSDDVWGARADDHKQDAFEIGVNFRYYF